ncbi:MAG TPA: AAA family ATPase [Candidatus Nanoarchaeia archaeon]|nr:AAA family ATPase [Candidatus Nanoarchaeia archaeon]
MFSTGCGDLDLRIGGFSRGINLIYGACATGKTTLGMMASNFFASKGKKVFYIDSENGFNMDRFKQISNGKVYDSLIVFKVHSLEEQFKLLEKLPLKCDLLVLDSLGYYYREELKMNYLLANTLVKKYFNILKKFSVNSCVLVLNQVYCDINNNVVKCVGGNFVMENCNSKYFLSKNPRKLIFDNKSLEFEINDKGIYFF